MKILVMLYSIVIKWVFFVYILIILTLMVLIMIKNDPETIIHIRLLAWNIKFEKHKALKKELNVGIFACFAFLYEF